MSHELIMLRNVKRMRILSQTLTQEARNKAIRSHTGVNLRGGTMGQIEEICQLIKLRDDCLLFCTAVLDGLNAMDVEMRKLLEAFYFKRVEIIVIAKRYNVSVATVYRRLAAARSRFKQCLNSFGYNEKWFAQSFVDFCFDDGKSDKKRIAC